MKYEELKGRFARIVIQKTEAYFGTVQDVKDNLVVFKTTRGKILTLSPENISEIVPNGKEVEDERL